MITQELGKKIMTYQGSYFDSDFTKENFEEVEVIELYQIFEATKKLIVTNGEIKNV